MTHPSGGTVSYDEIRIGGSYLTVAPKAGVVAPAAPSGITGSGATLNGSVNPNGSPATVRFEWGPTTSYNQSTSAQSLASGGSDVTRFR